MTDFTTLQNFRTHLSHLQADLVNLRSLNTSLEGKLAKIEAKFKNGKVRDEFVSVETHERKYEQDLNASNIVRFNGLFYDLERRICACFDPREIDGTDCVVLSPAEIHGTQIYVGPGCKNITVDTGCSHVSIQENCTDVFVGANNSHVYIEKNNDFIHIDPDRVYGDGMFTVKEDVDHLELKAEVVGESVVIAGHQTDLKIV